MNIQERLARIQEQQSLPDAPLRWEEKFIINSGETPWWVIDDPEEHDRAYHRQFSRMWYKLHPDASARTHKRNRIRYPGVAAREQREWSKEHPGAHAEAMSRFKENHPRYFAEKARSYREEHPEPVAESRNRYYKTPKGRAMFARRNAKRRERSTDPALYGARVELLHALNESCARCHTPYAITHQIDHTIPLYVGGTDEWSNLQPLCILCHRKKTAEDRKRYG